MCDSFLVEVVLVDRYKAGPGIIITCCVSDVQLIIVSAAFIMQQTGTKTSRISKSLYRFIVCVYFTMCQSGRVKAIYKCRVLPLSLFD